MFIRLLFGGVELLQKSQNEMVLNNKKEEKIQRMCLSIAQDIVFNVSGGKKHIGLGLALTNKRGPKTRLIYFQELGISLAMIKFFKLTQRWQNIL